MRQSIRRQWPADGPDSIDDETDIFGRPKGKLRPPVFTGAGAFEPGAGMTDDPPQFLPQIPPDNTSQLPPPLRPPEDLSGTIAPPSVDKWQQALSDYEDDRSLPIRDENGRLRSALIGAAEGLGEAFQTPVGSWRDFAGRLGAGIGGAAGGALNPKFDERQKQQYKIARDVQNLNVLQAGRQADFQNQKAQTELNRLTLQSRKLLGEINGQDIENINKQIAPYLDTIKAQKQITPLQAEILSRTTGLPWNAAVWQTYIDTKINGQVYTRPETSPDYSLNESVPADSTEVPADVRIGSSHLSLTPKETVPLVVQSYRNGSSRHSSPRPLPVEVTPPPRQFSVRDFINRARARGLSEETINAALHEAVNKKLVI